MEHLVFTLVTFVLFTALVGIISGKIVKNSDDQKTAKGYFLAGNGLGGFFIAGSMLLTNLSAENLVGLSGQSYAANMSGMAWEATAVIATIIMAFVFLPMYLRKGYTTLPEFMEERYGVGVRRMVSILFLIGYLVIGIPVCLYAGAIAFEQIFDFATVFGISEGMALTILIVLVGIIGALYAVLGGMRAVAVSDTINGILLVLGSVLVVVFGFIAVGKLSGGGFIVGVKDVITYEPAKLNAIGGKNDPVPFACIFTGMLLANLFYWGTNQVLIQRALGAENLKEGQKGVLLSGFLKMMVPLLLVIPGVIAARLVPGLTSKDFAYPSLVARSLPWPVVGLFCAAFAIIFTPFLDVLSTGLYDFGRSFTGFYNIPIITMVLVGMFSKKGSKLGAICATIFHIAFYACYKFIFPHIDTPFTNAVSGINYMYIYAISFVIMLVIIFVCSKIAPNTKVFDKSASRNDGYDMTAWKHKNAFAIWLVSFLVYEYFIFSPAGIATENKNVVRIAIVTAIFVIETIVLIVKEMNKRKKTA